MRTLPQSLLVALSADAANAADAVAALRRSTIYGCAAAGVVRCGLLLLQPSVAALQVHAKRDTPCRMEQLVMTLVLFRGKYLVIQ